MSTTRVGFIIKDHPGGDSDCLVSGAVKNPFRLLRWLRRSVTVTGVVIQDRPGSSVSARYPVLGRPLRFLRLYARTLCWNIANAPAIASLARRSDVIQCHHPHLGLTAALLRRFRHRDLRLIVKAHGTAVPELAANSYGGARGLVLRLNAALHLRHDRLVLRWADRCVVSSEHQVAEMVDIYGLDAERVTFVPNGFDPDFLLRRRDGASGDGGPHLLVVARVVPKKGLLHALDTFAEVRRSAPAATLTMVLGHRDRIEHSGTWEIVRERADALEGVRIRFDLDEPALYREIAAADVGLVPSRGYESIPTVLLEMCATGLPVFATWEWGIREVLPERFALSGDVSEDARRLLRFATDELPGWDSAAWAARYERYGYDRIAQQWSDLYDEVLGRHGA